MPSDSPTNARARRALQGFRPRARCQARVHWIRVRVTNEERAAFQETADKFGTTISTLVRQLVEHARTRVSGACSSPRHNHDPHHAETQP